MTADAVRILGIDPGLRLTGYAVVEAAPGRWDPALVEAGVIRLDADASVERRLVQLRDDVREVIAELRPGRGAVETLFAHVKHPRTAILMGHARGVILLELAAAGLPVGQLTATAVKKSLTGGGHASKGQVQRAVQSQLGLAAPPEPPDVADAIAIALCAGRRLATGR
ncbi:crossover junction endodeoxyribonuclease RuvC [Phycisphaera mikurensis]|uniref:Crossover junction endodeoxyribonuclease RuvC n=1 Tax=Phycisphaera mikurensis (strain NBRC 102666 / KCTC 22515 / FYK2301M01) TaxID=1142394 RepID=I0IIV3_PHYMF|nr:crossover junction endodeoxyribonuclease RuvC [Phycisphaera mikurensis]MBB6443356.1 crossover junction endodeoxyribonuclease RuvC [Phycisphaera mikurensis]BAM05191.1 crossover junction endodeoxyribonuclease RuvC [Phycisphaera mikurensis NBRC 102666]